MILELLRDADLESTFRKYGVTAATLTLWRDRFLAGGEVGLKSRGADVDDEEKRRLKSVVATVSVGNELPARENRPSGERTPFGFQGVESMSRTISPSSSLPYGVPRVVTVWNLARSSFYAARQRGATAAAST